MRNARVLPPEPSEGGEMGWVFAIALIVLIVLAITFFYVGKRAIRPESSEEDQQQ